LIFPSTSQTCSPLCLICLTFIVANLGPPWGF
jgi:hypothetical protein